MDRGVLTTGTVVGSYVIERELADGGMGTIYEATHRILRRRVALKVLHRHLLDHVSAAERLTQEARILEDVQHAGVVGVHDAGYLSDGRPWLAMELLSGLTLAQRLERAGRLTVHEVVTILRSLVETLGVAHACGVVHRDLKPDNIILVTGPDGAPRVKLIDWGVAWVADRRRKLTELGITPGTPDYMSPEQVRGGRIDGASDVYALGVIATEMLCGETPFAGGTPIEIVVRHLTEPPPRPRVRRPDVPARLDATIVAMLAKTPADRPSIPYLLAQLDQIAAELDDPEIEIEWEVDLDLDDYVEEVPEIEDIQVEWELAVA